MKADEKIFVRQYVVYTTEDIYAQGEVGKSYIAWDSKDNPVNGRFRGIEHQVKQTIDTA